MNRYGATNPGSEVYISYHQVRLARLLANVYIIHILYIY